MNVSPFSILKTSLLRRTREVRLPQFVYPMREWFTALVVTMFVFGALAGYIGYDFYTQYHEIDAVPVVTDAVVTYERGEVNEVLERHRAREREFDRLRSERRSAAPMEIPQGVQGGAGENIATSTDSGTVPLAE